MNIRNPLFYSSYPDHLSLPAPLDVYSIRPRLVLLITTPLSPKSACTYNNDETNAKNTGASRCGCVISGVLLACRFRRHGF